MNTVMHQSHTSISSFQSLLGQDKCTEAGRPHRALTQSLDPTDKKQNNSSLNTKTNHAVMFDVTLLIKAATIGQLTER